MPSWRSALARGSWGLADQAVVSVGTFLVNVTLARSLPLVEYGEYALVFAVQLFVSNLCAAPIAYPLAINGALADRAGLARLTGGALGLVAVLVLPLGAAALGATCWVLGRPEVFPWSLGALVLWQLQEILRRGFMAQLRHREALAGDAVSYLGQVAALFALAHGGRLSVESAFGAMAATSGLAACLQAMQLGLRSIAVREVRRVARDSYALGRWVLLTNLFMGLTDQVLAWALVSVHGARALAGVQAASNLLRISHPVMFALGNLVVPATARARHERGMEGARRVAWGYGGLGAVLLLPYFAAVTLWPHEALRAFYGPGSPYLALDTLLPLLAVCYALIYLAHALEAFLKGLADGRSAFVADLAGALTGLAIGLPLVVRGGMPGFVAAATLTHAVRSVVAGGLASRQKPERDPAFGPGLVEVPSAGREA